MQSDSNVKDEVLIEFSSAFKCFLKTSPYSKESEGSLSELYRFISHFLHDVEWVVPECDGLITMMGLRERWSHGIRLPVKFITFTNNGRGNGLILIEFEAELNDEGTVHVRMSIDNMGLGKDKYSLKDIHRCLNGNDSNWKYEKTWLID